MATNSVAGAFKVLEAVAELQPVGLSDLAREVGLPKSTTQRMLLTLAEIGWLRASTDAPTRWSLTYRALRMGRRVDARLGVREVALPVMSELQLETTETVHLAVPDGDVLILLERVDTSHRLRAFLPLGEHIPFHASATGQAYLSACTDDEVERYLAGDLAAVAPGTITDAAALRERVQTIRERGWSINEGGLSQGITALGAPIVDRSGRPVGAMSVSGPSSRMTPDRYEALGTAVAAAAARTSQQLEPGALAGRDAGRTGPYSPYSTCESVPPSTAYQRSSSGTTPSG